MNNTGLNFQLEVKRCKSTKIALKLRKNKDNDTR